MALEPIFQLDLLKKTGTFKKNLSVGPKRKPTPQAKSGIYFRLLNAANANSCSLASLFPECWSSCHWNCVDEVGEKAYRFLISRKELEVSVSQLSCTSCEALLSSYFPYIYLMGYRLSSNICGSRLLTHIASERY